MVVIIPYESQSPKALSLPVCSDFAGMMRPGDDQSTPFGLSAAGLAAKFLPRMDADAHGLKTRGRHI
jgi:hypothetical protein